MLSPFKHQRKEWVKNYVNTKQKNKIQHCNTNRHKYAHHKNISLKECRSKT
jgi:hypothetical protein